MTRGREVTFFPSSLLLRRYCPNCKTDTSEVIGAGESARLTKKKASMASKRSSNGRNWGRGMAVAGLSEHCTIVPPNHFGAIPGVPVGSMWLYRNQVKCGLASFLAHYSL